MSRRKKDDWFGPELPPIPQRSFPNNLAAVVAKRWDHICGGSYVTPPCPPRNLLKTLLEIAYLTASAPEESRFPQFNVVATPADEQDRQINIGCRWRFDVMRDLSVPELRRLAPAVDVRKSAIWTQWNDKEWSIVGMADLGTAWHRARMGLSYDSQAPGCLLVQIDRPGRMRVYQGSFHVATLTDGVIEGHKGFELSTLLGKAASHGLETLADKIVPPEIEEPREYNEFEFIALWNTYAAIANSISLSGHGGALIVVPAGKAVSRRLLSVKYPMNSEVLRSSFIKFINARHVLGDLIARAENDEKISDEQYSHAELESRLANAELVEATRFVAQLAGCDGAVVISDDLTLIGFGAEIRADLRADAEVVEVIHELRREYKALNIEQFGMRHRSAIKLVSQEHELVALVVSQDRPVSGIWWDDGRVVVRKGINLVNMNMPWA